MWLLLLRSLTRRAIVCDRLPWLFRVDNVPKIKRMEALARSTLRKIKEVRHRDVYAGTSPGLRADPELSRVCCWLAIAGGDAARS